MLATIRRKIAVEVNNALAERQPITLDNGIRTTEYQTWKIAFGKTKRGSTRVIRETKPIVFRELQEDRFGTFLYKKLVEIAPQRLFPPEHYYLEYHLPDAPFRIQVTLTKITEVKRAYVEFDTVPKSVLDKLANMDRFNIVPRNPNDAVFNSEPEDVTQGELRTVPQITAFLADGYLAGRISIRDFDRVMKGRPSEMRRETFLLIPRREQHQHLYLKEERRKKKISAEDAYRQNKINLEEYIDLKFPERVVAREQMAKHYPLPELPHICIICGENRAHIKCMECENRVCKECIERVYMPDDDTDIYDTQTYLLIHHTHCLKNGVPSKAFYRGVDRNKHDQKKGRRKHRKKIAAKKSP